MKSPSLDNNTVVMSKHLLILNRNNMRRLILHQGIGDLLNQMQEMRCHLQILKVHLHIKDQDKELLLLHQGMRHLHLHLGARIRLIPNKMKLMHHLKLIKIHHLNNVKAMETPTMSQATMIMEHKAIHIMDMVQEAFGTAEMKKKPLAS